uniref:Bestrophin homolog n=1 Tax=Syphacia muris TaxID=451379 RepID=A0A158R4X1_9BILA
MTITYNHTLATTRWTAIVRTIFRWNGSVWKAVYYELFIWCFLVFEEVVNVCDKYTDFVPLTFMLGYYVTLVVGRWWNAILNIGFIDNIALLVANYIRGDDERSMMYRCTIVRYMCLLQVMVYRTISVTVRKKFPTLQSLVDAGYVEEAELKTLNEDNLWLPLHWALGLVNEARDERIIQCDNAVQQIFRACADFRTSQITLWIYNWIPVPLLYTQVVYITVRLYFLLAVLGRQFTENDEYPIDTYVPFLTILQFIFYVGWLKVAESLLNPFGDDDDDFDAAWFLERNLRNAVAIVDDNYRKNPESAFNEFLANGLTNKAECSQIFVGKALATLPLFRGALSKYSGKSMTVHYHSDLASTNFLGPFFMILRWKGSLWKAVYQELILWLIAYAALSCTYAFWLTNAQKRSFERVVKLCNKYGELIPLTFMLGFYVTLVIERWWACMIRVAIIVANHVRGNSDQAKIYRSSLVRYVALIQLMVYRAISTPAKKRYPTLQSIVDAGYLKDYELKRFSENNFWICIQWALSLARKAREEAIILNDFALEDIYKACIDFRQNHIYLYLYSWIPIPLGYTQVVFVTVRLYFLVAAIGRQYIASDRKLWPRAFEILDEKNAVPPPLTKWRQRREATAKDPNRRSYSIHQALSALPTVKGK